MFSTIICHTLNNAQKRHYLYKMKCKWENQVGGGAVTAGEKASTVNTVNTSNLLYRVI